MGNNQIYKFCNCTNQELNEKEDNKYSSQAVLENGKMGKNDEEISMKFKNANLNSLQDESLKSKENQSENSSICMIVKVDLGDGDYYEGYLKKGLYHGEGKLIKSGQQYSGGFKNGKKDGKGEILDIETEKILFNGEFRNDLKHGKGKLIIFLKILLLHK